MGLDRWGIRQKFAYMFLQWKRAARLFPAILITTLLLAGSVWLFVHMLFCLDASGERKQKVQIGIVGNTEESYLGVGIQVLKRLDESRFEVDFYELTEEEAQKALDGGKLTAYVRIPDDFLMSIVTGENKPLTYVTTSRTGGMNKVLAHEVVQAVSTIVQESQTGIYSAQAYMAKQGMSWEDIVPYADALNLRYIDYVLHRSHFYEMEILGVDGGVEYEEAGTKGISLEGYYLCGLSVFFLMLWGISGCLLLIRKEEGLEKLLASRGIGVGWQIFGELSAYVLLLFLTIAFVGVLGIVGLQQSGVILPEWEYADLWQQLSFVGQVGVVAVMIAAFQFLLCELVSSLISGILVEFTVAVGLGYLSGCLYPLSFFPQTIQKIAGYLPSGVAIRYLRTMLLEEEGLAPVALWGYFVLFVGLAVWVRKCRIESH